MVQKIHDWPKNFTYILILHLDKFFSLLWSMVISCVEMKKMKKNEERKNEWKMMKEKKRKKDKPSTNHLKNYIEYQVKN